MRLLCHFFNLSSDFRKLKSNISLIFLFSYILVLNFLVSFHVNNFLSIFLYCIYIMSIIFNCLHFEILGGKCFNLLKCFNYLFGYCCLFFHINFIHTEFFLCIRFICFMPEINLKQVELKRLK